MNNKRREKKGLRSSMRILGRLLQYMKQYRFKLIFVFICIIITSAVMVGSSVAIKMVVDNYITPLMNQANPDFSGLSKFLIIVSSIFIFDVIIMAIQKYTMVRVTEGTIRDIREAMFDKMQYLPVKFFDVNSHGDIMSHFTNDTEMLEQMISESLLQAVSSVLIMVFTIIAMFIMSFYITISLSIVLVIVFIIVKFIAKGSSKYFKKRQKSIGKINGYIEEMIHGQQEVKVFCHEDNAKEDFNALNDEVYNNAFKASTYGNIIWPILGNIGHIQFGVIGIVGGLLALSGGTALTIGVVISFLNLSKAFTNQLAQLSQQTNSIIMAIAGAERIFNLIDEEPETDEGYVTLVSVEIENGKIKEVNYNSNKWAWKHPHENGEISYTILKGDIKMKEVDFGYNEEKQVLFDIDVYAHSGEKIAFVGSTGAGKTTITNLLNRFYDIADGKIRYDGININKIRKHDLRRSLGMVLQETNFFTGTVKENIKYGNLDATDEEVYAAAKLASADGFISRLPDGYDTVLTANATNLSQGQRQLISIARAAIADTPVMIFDEATSSIDTRTEKLVQEGTDKLMEGRTVFFIAHRLSTVKNSDVIMVLDKGRIIERGSHEKLISMKGKYYQLYTGAFELE